MYHFSIWLWQEAEKKKKEQQVTFVMTTQETSFDSTILTWSEQPNQANWIPDHIQHTKFQSWKTFGA